MEVCRKQWKQTDISLSNILEWLNKDTDLFIIDELFNQL